MYVCHHCGFISRNENVNYCNNVNCKYYGHDSGMDKPSKMPESKKPYPDMNDKMMPQKRSLMKTDSMTYDYEGDINYPSDMRMNHGMNNENGMNNMNGYNKPMDNMDYKKPMDMSYDKQGGMGMDMNRMGMKDMPMDYKSDMSMNYKKDMPDMSYKTDYPCGELAFATVPMQKPEKLYPLKEAVRAGTVFPSLNMPYNKKIIWRG